MKALVDDLKTKINTVIQGIFLCGGVKSAIMGVLLLMLSVCYHIFVTYKIVH